MRKYIVSITLFTLICPVAYLAWNGSSRRANAQGGMPPPAPPRNSQTSQGVAYSATILPPELAQMPQDSTVIKAYDDSVSEIARAKIEMALTSSTSIEFTEAPLGEIMRYLKDKHKIEIQVDTPGLRDAGVEPDVLVTKHVKNVSLRSALHLLLDDLQLKYVIHNDVLLITSPSKAESDEFMSTRFYLVKDLVLSRDEKGAIEVDFEPLQDLIMQTVAPKTWQENGGCGTIVPFVARGNCLLVISQTQDVHEWITDMLTVLHKAAATGGKATGELLLPIRVGRAVQTPFVNPGMQVTAEGGTGGGFPCP